jgi:uncharacterized protein
VRHKDNGYIGVISDTHGLLRPEAVEALSGADMILHAGDIGKPEVIDELENIAPVFAVRGNNDHGEWANDIPETQTLDIGGKSVFIIHDIKTIEPGTNADVIVFGHSHKALVEQRSNVLHLNPGGAGRRRFRLPVTVARLYIDDADVRAEIVELEI